MKNNYKMASILAVVFLAATIVVFPAFTPSGYLIASGDVISHWKFDEGSGIFAKDSAGGGSGELKNNPEWVAGKLGKALYFDGRKNYVSASSSNSLNVRDEVSVEAWVKAQSQPNEMKYVIWKANSYGLTIGALNGGNLRIPAFYIIQGGSPNTAISSSPITDGNWYHLVGTYDGSKISIYVDGKLKSNTSASGPIDISGYGLGIGGLATLPENTEPDTNYFNGTIDEVKIYKKSLTAGEVEQAYNSQLVLQEVSQNLPAETPAAQTTPVKEEKYTTPEAETTQPPEPLPSPETETPVKTEDTGQKTTPTATTVSAPPEKKAENQTSQPSNSSLPENNTEKEPMP